jgi:hypothetical protein
LHKPVEAAEAVPAEAALVEAAEAVPAEAALVEAAEAEPEVALVAVRVVPPMEAMLPAMAQVMVMQQEAMVRQRLQPQQILQHMALRKLTMWWEPRLPRNVPWTHLRVSSAWPKRTRKKPRRIERNRLPHRCGRHVNAGLGMPGVRVQVFLRPPLPDLRPRESVRQ